MIRITFKKMWEETSEKDRAFLRQFLSFACIAALLIIAIGIFGLSFLRYKVERNFSAQTEIANTYFESSKDQDNISSDQGAVP